MNRVLAGSVCAAMMAAASFAADAPRTTLDNLMTAYNGESNAKVRYEAFAVKADAEGYKGVASLFRAAAYSEGIHQKKHAAAIKALGGKAKADIKTPEVKSTLENLQAAMKGEDAENKVMYPEFIKQAEVDKNTKALYSFKGAMAAEAEHFKMFSDAAKNLEGWKAEKAFLVCTVCGYTTTDMAIKVCPVCSEPRSKFVEVK